MLVRRWWPVAVWLVVLRLESTDYASSANTFGLMYRVATAVFGSVNPQVLFVLNGALRKSGHFVGYAILSLLVFRALKYTQFDRLRLVLQRRWGLFFRDLWRWDWALIGVLFTLVAATLDELHQATTGLANGPLAGRRAGYGRRRGRAVPAVRAGGAHNEHAAETQRGFSQSVTA